MSKRIVSLVKVKLDDALLVPGFRRVVAGKSVGRFLLGRERGENYVNLPDRLSIPLSIDDERVLRRIEIGLALSRTVLGEVDILDCLAGSDLTSPSKRGPDPSRGKLALG